LLVHPVLDRPQLIGISRHITGACSIQQVAWDSSQWVLSGASESVAGQEYILFFHVPDNVAVGEARASAKSGAVVPVHLERTGALLSAAFEGGPEVVSWQLGFAPEAKH
jgi:hypothetical protein